MATNGTSFDIDIDARADSAESAAAKVDALARRLEDAGAAAQTASAAVAAAEKTYAQTEATADRAAKALEKINLAVAAQQGQVESAIAEGDADRAEQLAAKLEKLKARQAEAATAAEKANAVLAAEAAALDNLKVAAAEASEHEKRLAASHKQAEEAAEQMAKAEEAAAGSGNFKDAAEGLKKLGGPVGKLAGVAGDASEGVNKLTASLGTGVGLYVAAGVAIAALVVGLVAGTAAILKWSLGLADANRSAQLLSNGIAGSVAGGRALDAAIKGLEKRVPQTSDELRSMAADLAKTGLKGKALTDALEKTATEAAALKWGPDFAKGAISLDKLTTRLSANISGVFGGLKIDPALESFSKLVDLFDESSTTGKAMKVVFESIFQPLLDGLVELTPKIIGTFIQLEIWALKGLIAIKPYGSIIAAVAKGFAVLAAVAVGVLAIAIGAVVAGFVALVAISVACQEAGEWLGQQIVALAKWFGELGTAISDGVASAFESLKAKFDEFSSISLVDVGAQIIAGLAQGIMDGGAAVVSAITGVTDSAINAAKSALGIASPSKVFAEIGGYTAEGMAVGVDDGAGQVQSSLESMVSPPPAAAAPTTSTAVGGGNTFVFNVYGGGDAESTAQKVREAVIELFEGADAQLGRAVPA